MTILYNARTGARATDSWGELFPPMREATAFCLTTRFPHKYFYYIGENDTMPAEAFDESFLKPGGTC